MPLFGIKGSGQIFEQAAQPIITNPGDFWYDTVNNLAFQNISGTFQRLNTQSWQKLGTTTLGAPAANCVVAGLTGKKNLMILVEVTGLSVGQQLCFQFNNDVGANYSGSEIKDNGAPFSFVNSTLFEFEVSADTSAQWYVFFIRNITTRAKLIKGYGGTATGQSQYVSVGHWNNVAAQITTVTLLPEAASNLSTGTVVTVLGFDE